jgi:uncharacterized delta-60 repeat protein
MALSFSLAVACNVVLDIEAPYPSSQGPSGTPNDAAVSSDATLRDAPSSDAASAIESGPIEIDAMEGGWEAGDADATPGNPAGVVTIHIPPTGDASAVFAGGALLTVLSLDVGDAAVSNLRVVDLRVRPQGQVVVLAGDPSSPSCGLCSDHDVLLQVLSDGNGFDPAFGGDDGIVRLPLSFPGSFPGGGIALGDGSASSVLTTFSTRPGGAIALQPDGKVLVLGTCSSPERYPRYLACVERLNLDGTIDVGFGLSGVAVVPDRSGGQNYDGIGMALDKEGRVLVLATDDIGYDQVARLTPDGRVDGTFASISAVVSGGRAIAVQSSGRVLVLGTVLESGSMVYPYSAVRFNIVALNDSGVVDSTFAGGAGAVAFDWKYTFPPDTMANMADAPKALVVTGDDSIFALGTAGLAGSSRPYDDWKASIAVAKLTRDGALDSTFGAEGRARIVAAEEYALDAWSIVPLGASFYIAAKATAWQVNQPPAPLLLKLRSDGLLESSYPASGGEGVLGLPFELETSSQYALAAGNARLAFGATNLVDGGPEGILIGRPPL